MHANNVYGGGKNSRKLSIKSKDDIIKDLRSLLNLKKENKVIKKQADRNCYKPYWTRKGRLFRASKD